MTDEQHAQAYRIRQQSYEDQRYLRERHLAGSKAAYNALLTAWSPLLPDPGWDPVPRTVDIDAAGGGAREKYAVGN